MMPTLKKERKKSFNVDTVKLLIPHPHERKFSDHFNELEDCLIKRKDFLNIVIPDTIILSCKPSINVNDIDQEEKKRRKSLSPESTQSHATYLRN